jgi:hypothetical protein
MTHQLLVQSPPQPPSSTDPAPADPSPDRSRAGAVWVTALGAFLLFAAAGVFVAVQWDHIPDAFKLAVLGALSGGSLLTGRRLRPTLPAAGSVLYHLGAFLIPVVSAAVAVNQGVTWPTMLLLEGTVATVSLWVLNRVERSVVLDWATAASAVVLAGGIGACTPVPAPVALLALALVAELRRRHGAAISWAIVVGLAPLAGLVAGLLPRGAGVLADLGFVGGSSRFITAAVGLLAAAVLARNATRRRDLLLVVLSGTAAVAGLLDGWLAVGPTAAMTVVGLASLFLFIEVLAQATGSDAFWARPAALVADAAEAVTGMVAGLTVVTAVAFLAHRWANRHPSSPAGVLVVAGVLAAAGWLVADLRRRRADRTPLGIALLTGGGWVPGTVGMAVSMVAGVTFGTGSPLGVGAVALVVAAALIVSGRPGGAAVAVLLAVPAPLVAHGSPMTAGLFAMAGGVILAAAAVIRSPLVETEIDAQGVWLLGLAATLPVLSAGLVTVDALPALTGCLAAVALLWCTALVLDRGECGPRTAGLGLVPRAASFLTLVAAPVIGPDGVWLLAASLAALALADALLRRRPWMAIASGVLVPVAVGSGALAAGATLGQAALAVLVLGPIASVIETTVEGSWTWPVRVANGAALLGAGLLAGSDLPALATVILVVGGTAMFYGLRLRGPELTWLGGFLVAVGTWLHLLDHHVHATEPYLAPVAIALLIAGWQARRSAPISSWVAYGPAVALLGGSALIERVGGGGAGHALVAGAVGLAAVITGGRRRLIAPLLLGTTLVVALTAHESLAVTAGVPTWAWLALGGVTLVGVGIGMERAETGPLETGRRVVDVVSERFS